MKKYRMIEDMIRESGHKKMPSIYKDIYDTKMKTLFPFNINSRESCKL